MKMISRFAPLLGILLVCSCSSADPDPDIMSESAMRALGLEKSVIVMEPGKEYQRDGYRLRVDSIMNESRCPEDLVCVWAGNVQVRFEVFTHAPLKGGTVTFTLNTNASFQRDTVVQGLRYRLIDVSPYPKKDTPIQYEDYRVTVTVGDSH